MRLFHVGLDARLGRRLELVPHSPSGEQFFLVIHLGEEHNNEAGVRLSCRALENNSGCQGILFVSGSSFGGLRDAKIAERIESEYGNRVHFLRYVVAGVAVPENAAPSIREKFDRFFQRIIQDGRVEWDIIDPAWPSHLVALLLLLSSINHSVDKERVWREWSEMSTAWRRGFWSAARVEFRNRGGEAWQWREVGLPAEDEDIAVTIRLPEALEVVLSVLPRCK